MEGWNGDVYSFYQLYFALTLNQKCDAGNDDGNVIHDTSTFASSFSKRFWMKMCNMLKHIKVKGHLGGLWDPFMMFCPKVFIFVVNSPRFQASNTNFHPLIQFSSKYLGNF